MKGFEDNMADAMMAIYKSHAKTIRAKSAGSLDESTIDRQATRAMHETLRDQRLMNELTVAAMRGPVELNIEMEHHDDER